MLKGSKISKVIPVVNAGPVFSFGAITESTSTPSIKRSNLPGLTLLNSSTVLVSLLSISDTVLTDATPSTSSTANFDTAIPSTADDIALGPLPFDAAITYFNFESLYLAGFFKSSGVKAARVKWHTVDL